jgi:hypothetical protein
MFGAGNEPSTVAEFTAMFPTIDPAYNAGELISAGVTGAVSEGVNLWDEQWTQGGIQPQTGAQYYVATSIVTTHFTPIVASQTYYVKAPSNTFLFFYDSNKTYLGYHGSNKSNSTVVPADLPNSLSGGGSFANAAYMKFRCDTGGTYSNNICINVSNTAINGTYYPYQSVTLPIPSAVQALPGYGWSAGGVYNYIDWQRKVYVQRVGSVDLGNMNWYPNATFTNTFNATLYPTGGSTTNAVCSRYQLFTSSDVGYKDKGIAIGAQKTICYVRDIDYTDAAAFKTAMSGVLLYYELATPVETDISAYLTDDNLIAVEPGGTLTFENQLGDDYRLPVPSGVEYTIDLAPDTPSTDGTYTLQCTVADGVPTYSWVSA